MKCELFVEDLVFRKMPPICVENGASNRSKQVKEKQFL